MNKKEHWTFLQKFSALLQASLPTEEAMRIASRNIKNKKLKENLNLMIGEVSGGKSLKETFTESKWGTAAVALISAGEVSGTLATNLQRASDGMKSRVEQRSKMISSLFYPAIISCLSIGIIIFLLAFVYPKIIPLFLGMKVELPLSTRLLIKTSSLIVEYWLYVLVLITAGISFLFYSFIKYINVRIFIEKVLLRIPVIGNIILLNQFSEIAFVIGSLCQGGMTISDSIETGGISSFVTITNNFQNLHKDIASGVPLSDCISKQKIFPSIWLDLITVGERTGSLAPVLLQVSEIHRREIEETMSFLNKLIEPLMMIAVGIVVGFIALSIVTPMYSLTQHVQR